ncbi:unnamed protein product, partial [Meganyctiphanes norvegica]
FGFIALNPPPLPRWQALVLGFTPTVWACVGGTLIATCISYHIFTQQGKEHISANFILIAQALVFQPLFKEPERWRVKAFLGLWWLISYLIATAYSDHLIAVLTVP